MTDVHTPEQRSRNMAAIKGRDTKPEMIVRRLLHSRGYRYRLHDKRLPGRPDLAFAGRKKVIFVHGCYWHMHDCPFGRVVPKSNAEFWSAKRRETVVRDAKKTHQLHQDGWETLTVWECETRDQPVLLGRLQEFLKQ